VSARDLLAAEHGGDVDLRAMPASAVAACRAAWGALSAESAVVHGDPCAANVRVSGDGVGLLDWDEARVDHPDLDLADLPSASAELPGARGRVARAAVAAWEAAAGWQLEPSYARRRLAELD
jgi:aminoglycoside phosphotransferase (APT) family kinase protein